MGSSWMSDHRRRGALSAAVLVALTLASAAGAAQATVRSRQAEPAGTLTAVAGGVGGPGPCHDGGYHSVWHYRPDGSRWHDVRCRELVLHRPRPG